MNSCTYGKFRNYIHLRRLALAALPQKKGDVLMISHLDAFVYHIQRSATYTYTYRRLGTTKWVKTRVRKKPAKKKLVSHPQFFQPT